MYILGQEVIYCGCLCSSLLGGWLLSGPLGPGAVARLVAGTCRFKYSIPPNPQHPYSPPRKVQQTHESAQRHICSEGHKKFAKSAQCRWAHLF
eukprot:68694-Amphidinium_carterae.1